MSDDPDPLAGLAAGLPDAAAVLAGWAADLRRLGELGARHARGRARVTLADVAGDMSADELAEVLELLGRLHPDSR